MNTRPTPETDAMEIYDAMCDPDRVVASALARKLERERDEARGQRDRLAELHNKNAIYFNELLELCGMLRKERNMLAKALQNVIDEDGTPMSIERADEALQSLTTNESISNQ